MLHKVKVLGLWDNTGISCNVEWTLQTNPPKVDILSGGNGSGKSTLLHSIYDLLKYGELQGVRRRLVKELELELDSGLVISSIKNNVPEFCANSISTNFYDAKSVTLGDEPRFTEPTGETYTTLCDTIDSLFENTRKTIVRGTERLEFSLLCSGCDNPEERIPILWEDLSSGERALLKILFGAYWLKTTNCGACTGLMLLDEPEVSLHFEWQKRLLDDIFAINPKVQIILATHSPAIIFRGWASRVTVIDTLMC